MIRNILGLCLFVSMVDASAPAPGQSVSDFELVLRCGTVNGWKELEREHNGDLARFINYHIKGVEGGKTLALCLIGRPEEVPSFETICFFEYIIQHGADFDIQNDAGQTVRQLIQAPKKWDFQDAIRQHRVLEEAARAIAAGELPPINLLDLLGLIPVDAQPNDFI